MRDKFVIWHVSTGGDSWLVSKLFSVHRDGRPTYDQVASFATEAEATAYVKAETTPAVEPTAPLTLADALDTAEALRERVDTVEALAVKLTEDVEALSVEDGDLDRINDELKELRSDLDEIDIDEAVRGLVSEEDVFDAIEEAKTELERANQDLEATITELRNDIGDGDKRTDKRITDLEYRIERSVARISLVEASTFSACSTFTQRLRWLLTGRAA